MNLKRIIASTIVRRLTLLALAAVLAWLGLGGQAHAQQGQPPSTEGACPSNSPCPRDVALQKCEQNIQHYVSYGHNPANHRCRLSTNPRAYIHDSWGGGWNYGTGGRVYYFDPCPAGTVWNDLPGQQRCMTNCSSRGTPTFTPVSGAMIPNGSVGCSDGCEFMSSSNGDGTYTRLFIGDAAINHCSTIPNQCTNNGPGYVMNYGLGMCVPPTAECGPNEIKDPLTGMCTQGCPAGMVTDASGMCVPQPDNCPAGNVRAPSGECLPGEGQCAVGEARKPDGTCGRDSDGDGEPDDFDPDTDSTSFSGGENCNAPPSCSGDPVQCGMARIQWRIECNTRNDATVSGGSCGAMPVCVGKNCNALEYSQLLQQWRSACALERLAANGLGGGAGEGGQPDWTKVDGMNQDPGQGVGDGDTPRVGSSDIDGEGLDTTPIVGGGGSCPALGASGTGALVDNLVAMVNNPGAAWCSYIAAVYAILVLFGMATSILIMAKGW